MLKRLGLILMACWTLAAPIYAQLSQCAVTATVFDTSGALKAGARITVVRIVKNGSVIVNTPATYTTAANGTVTFNLPQSSTAYVYADAFGLNTNGSAGVALSVPATPTANLADLANLATVLTTLGDTLYAAANGVPARLAGSTSSSVKFYAQKGTGSVSAAPAWWTIQGSVSATVTADNSAKTLTVNSYAAANSPAQITADQNNYDPGSAAPVQRWQTDASRNITGLTFTTAQTDGQQILIWNVGAQNIVLVHESASSTAANRFKASTGANLTLSADQCAWLTYDGTSLRWRATKCN